MDLDDYFIDYLLSKRKQNTTLHTTFVTVTLKCFKNKISNFCFSRVIVKMHAIAICDCKLKLFLIIFRISVREIPETYDNFYCQYTKVTLDLGTLFIYLFFLHYALYYALLIDLHFICANVKKQITLLCTSSRKMF